MNQTHNHLPEKKVSVPAPTCFQRQKYLKITQNGQKFSVIAPLSRKKFFFFCPRPPHPLHPHHAVISSYTEVNSHAFSPSYRVFRPKNHDFVSHVADRSYVGLYISIVVFCPKMFPAPTFFPQRTISCTPRLHGQELAQVYNDHPFD